MNTVMKGKKSESGQAMVLIILAVLAIFGFGALALDMGQIYAVRRSAQAAADAAAMAAARDAIDGSKDPDVAVNTAFDMAAANGYNNDQVTNWVVVNNPPVDGPYCGICGNPQANEYYQVRITVRTKPIFAQLVYKGAERTTVEAIGHGKTMGALSAGDALLSLSTISTSLDLNGNTDVHITGGNIRSNGGMVKNGASGSITAASPGHIYYSTSFSGHTSPFSPVPQQGTASQIASIPQPYCPTASEAASWSSGSGFKYRTISGVNYYYYSSGLSVESLPSGVHCIEGGIGKGNYTGNRVLIVLLSGGVQQTGNDSINFRAAQSLIDANGNQWGGMVFFAPASNTSTFKFGGNSGAYFQGTIFAAGAVCDIGGTEDGRMENAAFICKTIKVHGTPDVNIFYKAEQQYRIPPTVELVQ
jgi:hypothetical protein